MKAECNVAVTAAKAMKAEAMKAMKTKVAARLARSKTRKQKAAKPMKAGERPKKIKQAGASHVDEVVKKRLREMPKMRYYHYYSDTETSESE